MLTPVFAGVLQTVKMHMTKLQTTYGRDLTAYDQTSDSNRSQHICLVKSR